MYNVCNHTTAEVGGHFTIVVPFARGGPLSSAPTPVGAPAFNDHPSGCRRTLLAQDRHYKTGRWTRIPERENNTAVPAIAA